MGLIQEQHPDRCGLFLQWKEMDFPILVDSLNRMGVWAVPLAWAIDGHGILRSTRPEMDWVLGEFLEASYPAPGPGSAPAGPEAVSGPVAHFLAGRFGAAADGFRQAVQTDPEDGGAWFGLGCALRARHDSEARQPGDFQGAVDAWARALRQNPRNYIWRRRIQQYGPRLDKPYPFYDWITVAREEIRARGATPRPIAAEPQGAEIAQPARSPAAAAEEEQEPDPKSAVPRDATGLVRAEAVVAPSTDPRRPGARIFLSFTPDPGREVEWDNSAGPLQVWVRSLEGVAVSARLHSITSRDGAHTREERAVEFEVGLDEAGSPAEDLALGAYALYFVCEGSGACTYLRQDLTIPLRPPPAGR